MDNKEKIILLELSKSHTEILYPQIDFLYSSGYIPVIFINENLNIGTSIISQLPEIIKIKTDNFLQRCCAYLKLLKYCKYHKIKNICLNTAQGSIAREFVLFFYFSKINIIGILHESDKLIKSISQKIISKKIKKYFVLSDYIKNYTDTLNLRKIRVEYLISSLSKEINHKIDGNTFKICIPGEVSVLRKNYQFLLDKVKKEAKFINDNITFILAGNPRNENDKKIFNEFRNPNINRFFNTFENFIEEDKFYKIISDSDIILPLVDNKTHYFDKYHNVKISGAFNLAYLFKKPLLMHESFSDVKSFRIISIFYNNFNFTDILNNLSKNKNTLKNIVSNYQNNEIYSFDFNRKKFISYLV